MLSGFIIGIGVGFLCLSLIYVTTFLIRFIYKDAKRHEVLPTTPLPTKIGLRKWTTKPEGY